MTQHSSTLRFIPLCLVFAVAACDCGDDDDTTVVEDDRGPGADSGTDGGEDVMDADLTPDGGVETLTGFAGDYAEAYCAKLEECFGPAFEDLVPFDCVGETTAELTDALLPVWRDSEEAGYLLIDETEAEACVDAAGDRSCAEVDTFLAAGCADLLAPQSDAGDPCLADEDCAVGTYCESAGACPGTCAAFAAIGEACGDTDCAPDAFCNDAVECEALPALGEVCDLDIACEGVLFCAGDGVGDATCQGAGDVFTVAEGGACQVSDAGPFCEEGLSCVLEGSDFVCRATVGSGEACVVGFPDPCPEGEFCNAADDTCTAFLEEGEDCSAARCAEGLVCGDVSDTCLPLARLGEACTEDAACGSLECADGTCVAPECAF